MQFHPFILFWLFSSSVSCESKLNSGENKGITVHLLTTFYDTTGNVVFSDTVKTWYIDSVAIQELHNIHRITDESGKCKVYYPVIGYRFMNLRTNRWAEFNNLSDTAAVLKSGFIPPGVFDGPGWNFYSKTAIQISGEPRKLHDTIVNGVKYQLFKFNLTGESAEKSYTIGYLRCDVRNVMFSLEKSFSAQNNCAMIKLLDYSVPGNRLFSKLEVEYIADTIPNELISIYSAWEGKLRYCDNLKALVFVLNPRRQNRSANT